MSRHFFFSFLTVLTFILEIKTSQNSEFGRLTLLHSHIILRNKLRKKSQQFFRLLNFCKNTLFSQNSDFIPPSEFRRFSQISDFFVSEFGC